MTRRNPNPNNSLEQNEFIADDLEEHNSRNIDNENFENDSDPYLNKHDENSFDENYDGNYVGKYGQSDSDNEYNASQFKSPLNKANDLPSEYTFKPDISPFAKKLKQDHISLRAKQVLEESNKKLKEIEKDLDKKNFNHPFHPQINSSYVMKRDRAGFHESIDERIHEKEEHYKKMEEKRQEIYRDDFSYTPEISTYSKTLERQEPIYERLYKLRKVIDSPDSTQNDERRDSFSTPNSARRRTSEDSRLTSGPNDAFPFQPKINETPQHILETRKGKIEDRMYEDAIKREQRREEEIKHLEQIEKEKRQTNYSTKTKKLAKQRVLRELQLAFDKVSSKDQEESYLTYVQLGHCLGLLGLFKSGNSREERRDEQEVRVHEEIWNLLDPQDIGKVTLQRFLDLLCPLIDPEMFSINETNEVNKAQIKQLSLRMKDLSVNKLAYSKTSSLLKEVKQKPLTNEPTFTPKINNVSKSIDSRISKKISEESSKSGPRYEILFQKESEKKMKLDSLRKSVDEKVMKECSFQPQLQTKQYRPSTGSKKNSIEPVTNGENRFEHLYNLRTKEPKINPSVVNRDEKELENCTFRPDTTASQQYREQIPKNPSRSQIRGFEQQIDRMKKAQQERNRVNNFYESLRKDIDTKWEGRMKQNGSDIEFQPTEVKPFNFNLDKRMRSKPLLFMDVNLGPGRTGRIGIHAHDDPEVLATNFATSYRLDQVLKKRLQDLIYQNMILNNIPIGDASKSPDKNGSSNSVNTSSQNNSKEYRSPAANYAGSHRKRQYEDQFEEGFDESYEEDTYLDGPQASPILRKSPNRSSPGYSRQTPPNPEPSPSRKLYDSLRQLKEFTENS